MKISDSELILLKILWIESPLTVGQMIQRAQKTTDWHDNTIKTLLMRLTKKIAVTREKDGRQYFYSANVDRDEILAQETEGFLSKYFGGKMAPFVAHFNKTKSLSDEEIQELEDILKRMKKK